MAQRLRSRRRSQMNAVEYAHLSLQTGNGVQAEWKETKSALVLKRNFADAIGMHVDYLCIDLVITSDVSVSKKDR